MNPCKKGSARAALFDYLQKPRTLAQFRGKAVKTGVDPSRALRFFRNSIPDGEKLWVLYEAMDGKIQLAAVPLH